MIGESFFHAFDPADWLFSNNVSCGRGTLTAVSALRHADPNLAAALSPYEAFTCERPKEDCFERVRAQEFPDHPPPLGSIFLFATRENADACNADWWGGARVILEAKIVSALSTGIFDARQLNAPPDKWETAARRYWRGEMTADARAEVLVNGTIQLVGWEPHARVGFGVNPQPTQ